MTRTEMYNLLRQHAHGAATITAPEVAGFLGYKNVSRVRAEYLDGLDRINGRYFIADVAKRLQQEVRK